MTGVTRSRGLRHNSEYWWLWFGQAISVLGDEVFTVTLTLWIATVVVGSEGWAPLAVTAVLVAEMLPVILLSPFAGVYADRWNRRRLMLIADAARGVLVAGLAGFVFAGPAISAGTVVVITCAVSALVSIATIFFYPARAGMLAVVVDDADRERAASLTMGTMALAGIIGPALGAGLLVLAGAGWAMLLNATSYAVSFVAVARMRTGRDPASIGDRATAQPNFWREFVDGLRYLAGNRTLKVVLVTSVTIAIATSSQGPLEVFFVTQNLNGSAELYGILGAIASVGALAGAAVMAWAGTRFPASKAYAYGLVASGVVLVCYSRMTTPLGGMIVVFFDGVALAVVSSMIGPLVLRSTPEHMVGRVSTALLPAREIASLTGMSATAWLASTVLHDMNVTISGVHFGPIDTIFMAGGLVAVVAGFWAARAFARRD